MKWKIKGADRKTAADRIIVLEAPTEADAIKEAGKSLLVETIEQINGEALSYASPVPPTAAQPPASKLKPDLTVQERVGTVALTVIAALFHVAGFLGLIDGWTRSSYLDSRFSSDNAIGATANAVEELIKQARVHSTAQTGVLLIIAALLAQNVCNQIVTRGLIRAQGAQK